MKTYRVMGSFLGAGMCLHKITAMHSTIENGVLMFWNDPRQPSVYSELPKSECIVSTAFAPGSWSSFERECND